LEDTCADRVILKWVLTYKGEVDWIHLAGDWDKLWAVLKAVKRFGVAQNTGNFFNCCYIFRSVRKKNAKSDC